MVDPWPALEAREGWRRSLYIVEWSRNIAIPCKPQHSPSSCVPRSTAQMKWSRTGSVLERLQNIDTDFVRYDRRKQPTH